MIAKKILVPIDVSRRAVVAIEHAVELAARLDAEVHVLHVGTTPATYIPLERWIWGEEYREHSLDERLRVATEKAIGGVLESLNAATRARIAEVQVKMGTPVETILEEAEKYDLVVIPTRGRTGSKRVLLGSVTERVIRHAPCDVLVVRESRSKTD